VDYFGDYSSYGHGYDYSSHVPAHGTYGGFSVDNTGRLVAADYQEQNLLNKYWASMHRQWGHQRETGLNSFGQPRKNLVDATRHGQFNVHHQKDVSNEGKHGKNWGDSWDSAWRDQPWAEDDDLDVVDLPGGNVVDYRDPDLILDSWGAEHGTTDFMASAYNKWIGKYFDASWELGDSPMHFGEIVTENIPYDTTFGAGNGIADIPGSPDPAVYSGYRWFEGVDATLNAGSSEVNDPAKLKCHYCDVRRELFWNGEKFCLVDPANHDPLNPVDKNDENLWTVCHAALKQRSCEYSAGTCFVEERRTWGYVTQIRAGCKQAQACYMQKYQNFLVQAGRQCWPGDGSKTHHAIAQRPYDLMADNWISNIVAGGIGNRAGGSSFSTTSGDTGDESNFLGEPFDNTFTDMPGGGMNPHGFFTTGGALNTGNTQHYNKHRPVVSTHGFYHNGMMPTSKCYQCCNTEHNCNYNWMPHDEEDWEHAYVWRYNPTSVNTAGGVFASQGADGLEQTPRVNDHVSRFGRR
jgi:hypothetical protein